MPAYVRWQSEYHNTSNADVLWRIDIVDTQGGGGIAIPFRTAPDPQEQFEGIPQDLRPGIYPTSFSFGMFIEHGLQEEIIELIAEGDEERFIVNVYKDYVFQFSGFIMADQCNYEHEWYPYIFNIEATDGCFRLASEDYVPARGQLEYKTASDITYNVGAAIPDPDPVDDGEVGAGTGWTMLEHYSVVFNYDAGDVGDVERQTTYVRKFIYAINSPGGAWFDQGSGYWTTTVDYTNEQIEEINNEYHLTRDIDDDPQRTILEYIQVAMDATGLSTQYTGVMYDTASEWYEQNMANATGDPFSMTRLHEKQFIGKNLNNVITEICKLFFLRLYYAQGRYHFEQISIRDGSSFTRWTYNSAGVLQGTENTSLDIQLSTYSITSGPTGQFKFLPPIRSVEISFDIKNSNFLDGFKWVSNFSGQGGILGGFRYLGRVKKEQTDHAFQIQLNTDFVSEFNAATLLTLPPGLQLEWSKHFGVLTVVLRIYNKMLATTHYRDADGAWSVTYESFTDQVQFFVTPNGNNPITILTESLNVDLTTDALPGNVGDLFEVYISVFHGVQWHDQAGANFWNVAHAGEFECNVTTHPNGVFRSIDAAGEEIIGNSNRLYYVQNNVNNTLKITSTVLFSDIGKDETAIEIWDGTVWVKSSSEWSIGGIGTGTELLELLASEIISLRMVPRRIFATQFLSVMPSADNRLQIANYFYLPLRADRNGDMDGFNGEFLQIAKTTSPGPGIIITGAIDDQVFPPLTTGGPLTDAPQIGILETEGAITAGPPAITQCNIANPQGVYVPTGARVRVVHPTSPDTWIEATLTQPIFHDSTVMYFVSVIFLNNYPDASPIYVEAQLDPGIPTSGFDYFDEDFTGTEIEAPSYTNFPDTEALGAMAINAMIDAFRNGTKIEYRGGSVSEQYPSKNFYDLNSNDKKFLFPVPLENESIRIIAQ